MTVLADTWDYLTTAANWTGDGGMLQLLVQQLLISVTALLVAMLIGLPIALVARPPRSRRASSPSTSPTSVARSRRSPCWRCW